MSAGRSDWSRALSAGMPVVMPDGQLGFIRGKALGFVQLVDAKGTALPMLPLGSVSRMLMTADNAPPDTPRADGLEERLTPHAREKAEEAIEIVRMVETGLRPDQQDGDKPADELNPALVPEQRRRVKAIATLKAPIWDLPYKSAKRRIDRILKRSSGGLVTLVDTRYIKPTQDRQHPDMQWWVQQWLIARAEETTVHGTSIYLTFRIWLAANHEDVACPPERTFAEICTRIYAEHPELSPRWSKKTQLSTARKPKVSHSPRKPLEPGELWLGDTTTTNILLRDPLNRPGRDRQYRAEKTKLIDAATRLVVGRSIAESTTGFGIGLALADAFASMVDPRQTVVVDGRTYPRPFIGLPRALSRYPIPPRRLLMDNGKPWLSHYIVSQLERLRIDVEHARVRDPRAKARIERSFDSDKTMMEEFQPGFVGGSVHGRGPAAEGMALLTFEEYWQRDGDWTDLWNFREHRGLASETGRSVSPYQLWAEGAQRLGAIEVPIWENEWIRFLPSFTQKMSPYGVVHKHQMFNAPIIEALLNVPGAAPARTYKFHFNPADLRQIYCFDPDGQAYEVPWVMRTEETPQFGAHAVTFMDAERMDVTMSIREYQDLMVHYLIRWQDENGHAAIRWSLASRNENMHTSAIEDLRSIDVGHVVTSDTNLVALPPYGWQEEVDDDVDDYDEDPFASFG
jgi:transposase InsO family protein